MKKIPITIPSLNEKDAQAAYDTVMSGWVTQGPRVEEFEKKFADYVGSEHAVAVSSCTTALHLSLIVAGIESGDEVICPSMSFIASANCIQYVGATPVFAEVDSTYNLDIEDVKNRITSKTKAILLVHQIGIPADIDAYKVLCNKNNLKLIEDAACAIGSSYKRKMIGSHSDLVCFSFHPRKVITTGDGGMITTSNTAYYERLKLLRQHGMSVNDRLRHESNKIILEEYLELGYNYRMTDIQAAIGIQQLLKLDQIILERRKLALMYEKAFSDFPYIRTIKSSDLITCNFQSYSIYLNNDCPISRDDLMQKLLEKGVSTRRGIMTIHRESAYQGKYYTNLPKSESLSDNSLLIPLYPLMTVDDIQFVIENVIKILLESNYISM